MSPQLDQNALLVKSRYFIRTDHSEENLRKLKRVIQDTMRKEGYINVNPDVNIFGPTQRRAIYRLRLPEPEPSLPYRVKDLLGMVSDRAEQEMQTDHYFKELELKRNDIPFEFQFHFWVEEPDEGADGYDVEVIAKPVLLQKDQHDFFEDGDVSVDDADIEAAVATCKRRIREVMRTFGIEPYVPPHTESAFLQGTLTTSQRELLQDSEYGRYTIQFIEEGDEALRNNLYNAAMSCYVHGIEWTIIDYFQREHGDDLIKQEKIGEELYFFTDLVDRLEETAATQKTVDRLSQMNANERRWIAHHKSGQAVESDVRRVRDPLQALLDELLG